jgi:hypothetical protein
MVSGRGSAAQHWPERSNKPKDSDMDMMTCIAGAAKGAKGSRRKNPAIRFSLAVSLLCVGVAGCVDVHSPQPQSPAATIVAPAPMTYVSPGTTTYVAPGSTTTVGPAGTTTVQRAY